MVSQKRKAEIWLKDQKLLILLNYKIEEIDKQSKEKVVESEWVVKQKANGSTFMYNKRTGQRSK